MNVAKGEWDQRVNVLEHMFVLWSRDPYIYIIDILNYIYFTKTHSNYHCWASYNWWKPLKIHTIITWVYYNSITKFVFFFDNDTSHMCFLTLKLSLYYLYVMSWNNDNNNDHQVIFFVHLTSRVIMIIYNSSVCCCLLYTFLVVSCQNKRQLILWPFSKEKCQGSEKVSLAFKIGQSRGTYWLIQKNLLCY